MTDDPDRAIVSLVEAGETLAGDDGTQELAPSAETGDVEAAHADGADAPLLPDNADAFEAELALLPANDTGNAQRLIRRFGDRFRFVRDVGPFVWTGTHWDGAGGLELMKRLAQDTAAAIRGEARALRAAGPRDGESPAAHERRVSRHFNWAVTSGNSGKIAGMIDQAAPHTTVTPDDLDQDPLLLNVANGTLEFSVEGAGVERVGRVELRRHRREDLLSKVLDAVFDPDAPAERFLAFLATVVPDAEIRLFLQVWCGYCLTGLVGEQKLVFLYGSGANGKSTFVDLVARMLQGYAASLRFESLAGDQSRRGDAATPDLARLPGVRFLRAAEPEQGIRFKAAEVKSITGGEPMLVRHLHGRFFELRPCFKLVLSGNHKPDIRELDEGIWRRILLVPFTVTVPASERDPDLPAKLWAERSGILNWMLDGLRIYLEEGLAVPAAVLAATADYRDEQDPIGLFLRSCTVPDPAASVRAGDLFKAYTAWCEEAALSAWKQTSFGRALREKGIRKEDGGGRPRYVGLRLSVDAPSPPVTGEEVL